MVERAALTTDDRLERARLLYERAVFGGDADALPIAEQERTAGAKTRTGRRPTARRERPS